VGEPMLVGFGALALVGGILILVGAFQRTRAPKLWGFTLLSAGVGAWMLGTPGIVLGVIVFFLLRARRQA